MVATGIAKVCQCHCFLQALDCTPTAVGDIGTTVQSGRGGLRSGQLAGGECRIRRNWDTKLGRHSLIGDEGLCSHVSGLKIEPTSPTTVNLQLRDHRKHCQRCWRPLATLAYWNIEKDISLPTFVSVWHILISIWIYIYIIGYFSF